LLDHIRGVVPPAGVPQALKQRRRLSANKVRVAPQRFVEPRFINEIVSSGFADALYKAR